jgi:hypothetical protein
MFIVCKVDEYDPYDRIQELVAYHDSKEDAENTAKFYNLEYVYKKIKTYEGFAGFESRFLIEQLVKNVENHKAVNEPYNPYIVVDLQLVLPPKEYDVTLRQVNFVTLIFSRILF